jgi:hypothetical protein
MDEKKKIMILAVLGVMTLGIGAFQFMPKSQEPAPVEKKEVPEFLKENEAEKAAANQPPRNPLLAANLTARDPFQVPGQMQGPRSTDTPVKMPRLREPRPRKEFTSPGIRPFKPGDLGSLPGGPTGPVTVSEPVKEPEAPFGYTVGGVVVGARPAVVFRDAAGNQRLVMQGGDLDGDSTVKMVRMDHVVVVHKGKSLRLKVGGDTVAK